jgi:DnaJ family protein C protein 8
MEEVEEGLDEYKVVANSLKDQGNEAFQAGDVKLAISYFSQAIDLDPDNHVFYSNRSAAYMKDDSKSKALKDAEKCVELAPDWAKGYGRLGAAQQGLRRFDAGEDSFKKGIELDPNSKALWSSLKSCQEAHELDKKAKCEAGKVERAVEEKRIKRREELKKEVEEKKAKDKAEAEGVDADAPKNDDAEDDLLASFFSEVAPVVKEPVVVQTGAVVRPDVAGAGEAPGVDESAPSEKYATQDLGEGRDQFDRLTGRHCEWRNLNPYAVLQLGADATEEDIKQRFRKMSLKVHPDRLRDVPNARDAFEAVKDAYAKLTDESLKKNILMHMETVDLEVKKDRRASLKAGKKDTDLLDFDEHVNREAMKHFAGTHATCTAVTLLH